MAAGASSNNKAEKTLTPPSSSANSTPTKKLLPLKSSSLTPTRSTGQLPAASTSALSVILAQLPQSSSGSSTPVPGRPRGHSTSSTIREAPAAKPENARIASDPYPMHSLDSNVSLSFPDSYVLVDEDIYDDRPSSSFRHRARSASHSQSAAVALARGHGHTHSLTGTVKNDNSNNSSFDIWKLPGRLRSGSVTSSQGGHSRDLDGGDSVEKKKGPAEMPSTWWNSGSEHILRPWRRSASRKKEKDDDSSDSDSDDEERVIPKEQEEGWVETRDRVRLATSTVLNSHAVRRVVDNPTLHKVLDTAADVTHEALVIGVDVLQFAPVIGLEQAARVLLGIWDSVQMVDMNRLACLRLTSRCAEVLLSVHAELEEAGSDVLNELADPMRALVDSFKEVQNFLQKQVHRPFLKRYLKRDEILKQIAGCDAGLSSALGMFSLKIQVRILRSIQDSDRRRHEENEALISSFLSSSAKTITALPDGLPPSSSHPSLGGTSPPPPSYSFASHGALGLIHEGENESGTTDSAPSTRKSSSSSSNNILPSLRALHDQQNYHDAAHDTVDLRQLMRAALQTSSDAEMLTVLQVGREEMPEAIKTLQRALEKVCERESVGEEQVPIPVPASAPPAIVDGDGKAIIPKLIRRVTGGSPRKLERRESVTSGKSILSTSHSSSSNSAEKASSRNRDTLDREFLEGGIDALRRMSRGSDHANASLPSWTITRYEVDREKKIGIGFFSDVYRGSWRGRTVAIKVLAPTTPRHLFVHEVEIWKTLKHGNVLELYGASSASGDPPWFFVSPYLANGSAVEYLRRIREGGKVGLGNVRGKSGEIDLLKMMHEVSKGMEYLHSRGVLHGDLKAANVLVDDRVRCVISDFGQSEMKSEALRISGTVPPHGTLRWQAPELMTGSGTLTQEMDVYAFAISTVEILTMGRMPWPLMDDEAVRHFVIKDDTRPTIPNSKYTIPALHELLRLCWHRDPLQRPPFSRVVKDIKQIRMMLGAGSTILEEREPPLSPRVDELVNGPVLRHSPDMHPLPLPLPGTSPSASESSYLTASESIRERPGTRLMHSPIAGGWVMEQQPYKPASAGSHSEDTVSSSKLRFPEPVIYTSVNSGRTSRASSLFTSTPSDSRSEENVALDLLNYEGYDSPPPANERLAEIRDERRYRMLLSHDFHPSLTLPLWSPLPVSIGAVGYLSKPSGSFVTLFNAFTPSKAAHAAVRNMPSLHGYGRVSTGAQRQDKRNAAQRGLDAITGMLTFKRDSALSQSVSRRYSMPLRAGQKTAYLYTESTMYRYVESLDTPKKWFKGNIDDILSAYGTAHRVQKEDVVLIIGTLDALEHALFVSHNHPEGQAHFNVFSSAKAGQPWGMFTTDTELSAELGGPSYHEPVTGTTLSACKVSNVGSGWESVLLARLRFKPDAVEPTSL